MQSTWENRVDYNLSESGVHPLSLCEFLSEEQIREVETLELGYPQSNGTEALRRNIARRYPGAGPDNILVTSGGSEANFLSICRLVERGDQISMILPHYMQMWGLGRSLQAQVNPLWMRRDSSGWRLDLDLLRKLPGTTRALIVCNPNNPTGAILNGEEINAIVEAAERAQAYLICDEIYCGAEHDAEGAVVATRGAASPRKHADRVVVNSQRARSPLEQHAASHSHSRTPSFWGRYPKVIITNGLSKAYGLPGLRIGWIATTADLAEQLWSYHDYTTISMSMLSERIATIVLSAKVEPKILERTRKIIRDNYREMKRWLHDQGVFEWSDPQAGAIVYARYDGIDSLRLVEDLRKEKSVLVVPGAHFLMDNYLRFGFGSEPEKLKAGLNRVAGFLKTVAGRRPQVESPKAKVESRKSKVESRK